jgi:hypothetical protein
MTEHSKGYQLLRRYALRCFRSPQRGNRVNNVDHPIGQERLSRARRCAWRREFVCTTNNKVHLYHKQ